MTHLIFSKLNKEITNSTTCQNISRSLNLKYSDSNFVSILNTPLNTKLPTPNVDRNCSNLL
jgi:hypothetical protein